MRVRRGADVAVIAVAAGIGLAACSSGPSIDEIGPQFEQDVNAIFDALGDTHSADPSATEIVSDGTEDVSCEDGVRREFEGTFPMIDGDPDNTLDQFTRAVVTVVSIDHPYEMVSEDGGNYTEDNLMTGSERTYYATNEDETITFEIHATAGDSGAVTFTAETACAPV